MPGHDGSAGHVATIHPATKYMLLGHPVYLYLLQNNEGLLGLV